MNFKAWFEDIDRDAHYWQEFFLSAFRLDRKTGGLGKNVAGLDAKALTGSSEFENLPPERQQQIVNRISQGNGTVGDLATVAAGTLRKPTSTFAFPPDES